MPRSDCFVSVVAPLSRDGDIVTAFVTEVLDVLRSGYENYELVLVDDGSDDDTAARVTTLLAEHDCVRLIRLSREFGRETAISAGLDSAIGDFVVVMLPDSDPPALIPPMVERCRQGLGVVFGIRAHRRGEPLWLRAGAGLFYWYFNRVLKGGLPPNSSDFRVFSRQAVNAITQIRDRLRYLRTFSVHVGYGTASFVYEPVQRRPRPRRRGLGAAVSTALNMVVANTLQPLHFVSVLGLVLALLCLAYVVYVVVVHFLDRNVVPGWATQSLQSGLMFMFVFLVLSTLSAYVGRLLDEMRDRPLYYVLEERNSSVMLVDEKRKNVVVQSTPE
jgi:polyisoprenyl-phosphate glycosyltransferase